MTARCALCMVPWKFSRVPDEYAHGYIILFAKLLMGFSFVPIDPMNVRANFKVSFTGSWDNRGYLKTWAVTGYAHASFSQFFHGLLFGWTLRMHWPNLKSVALPVPELIAIKVLDGGCEPQSWERGGRRASGMVPFERAKVSSYRLPIVTFPLSLRVSEILPLLCSSTPLFLTPPVVSPKFPHVPLGFGGWRLGYEERRCYANCPCN